MTMLATDLMRSSEAIRIMVKSGFGPGRVGNWKSQGRLSNPGHGLIVRSEFDAELAKLIASRRRKRSVRPKKAKRKKRVSKRPKAKRSRAKLTTADYDRKGWFAMVSRVSICESTGCWNWTGSKLPSGYGIRGRPSRKSTVSEAYVHRAMWSFLVGPIPKGLVIDHLCRNTSCCNPKHLRCATQRDNLLSGVGCCAMNHRKTHCKNGHPLSGGNLVNRLRKDGSIRRVCKACKGYGPIIRAKAHAEHSANQQREA